ncbi:hypothetical protein M406DRAFT_15900, partial [Cryphonectria parasitica EP155]
LAGVGSALALKQAGHRVTLLERAPEIRQVGAGIQLSPNATRILEEWGVLEDVLAHAYQPETGGLRAWRDGAVLSPALPPASKIKEIYRYPYVVVHRADLLEALITAASKHDIALRLSCEVTKLELSQKPAVYLANGDRIEGDVILGADGERSFCRDVLLGRPDPPQPTGDVVFRIAVSRSDILGDKNHPSREIMQPGSINVWMGPDAHAVSYVLNNSDILNVVLIRKDETQRPEDVMYGPRPASLEELRRAYDGWDPALQALIGVPGETDCAKWNLLRIDDVKNWRHEGGSFALIGDAAHAMPPFLAQGAAQAFEDAAVLGAIFARVSDKMQIPHALEVFEELRKPRANEVKSHTLARKEMYGLHDGPEQEERDGKLALGSVKGCPDELADPDFQKWLWGYDAAADGARAWE